MAKPAKKKSDGWSNERSAAGDRNPWTIVAVISLATFMEVLDTSIANVSLDHIAGGLSISTDEAAWVLTSYLVANAIVIPLSGWLSDVIGRKRYYMLSVLLFTISSLACGLAFNLPMLLISRVFQGIGGGGLASTEQSFLADTFPPAQRGQAFAAYAIVVVCGPVIGPTLGGWITDNISWHWIFLINVPVGIVSLILVHFLVAEPEILEKERRQRLKKGLKVDYVGFALVALGLGCLEVTMDRGQRDDWFGSPFITVMAIIAAVALVGLVVWELNNKDPVVNLKLLKNRNFAITIMLMLTAGLILFGTTQLIPQMLQSVFSYTATNAGLALTIGGIATIVVMPFVGMLTGKVDTRLLLFPAMVTQVLALWNLSHFSTDISFGDASSGRLYQAMALPFLFVPITAAAYVGLKPTETNQASGLLNVARNLGGDFGISIAQAMLLRREQFNHARIVEGLNPLNPNYVQGLDNYRTAIGNQTSDTFAPLGALAQEVNRQATMLSYIDVFHAFMIFVLIITPFALFLRPGKGAEH